MGQGLGASDTGRFVPDDLVERIRDYLRASPRTDAWLVVPRQWTSEMAHAGYLVHKNDKIACAECGAIYAAMLAAAPKFDASTERRFPPAVTKAIVESMPPHTTLLDLLPPGTLERELGQAQACIVAIRDTARMPGDMGQRYKNALDYARQYCADRGIGDLEVTPKKAIEP
jgi:hypothetical protein